MQQICTVRRGLYSTQEVGKTERFSGPTERVSLTWSSASTNAGASRGGAAGDSVACIAALAEFAPEAVSVAPGADPEAAAQCHAAGVGADVTLRLGHRLDPRWGDPMSITGTVEALTDGRFVHEGGIREGVIGEMGPTVFS